MSENHQKDTFTRAKWYIMLFINKDFMPFAPKTKIISSMRIKGLLIFLPVLISGFVLLFYRQQPIGTNTDVSSFQNRNGFVIAENKKCLAPIILPKENTPFMKEAANDLASYIEKISGAKPKILEGMPSPVPAKAIWVGYQKGIEKHFPGIDFNYKYPEEIINAANEKHIIISGRDRWNPDAMVIPDRTGKKMVTGIQQEYGTCNAVYTFLQDQLGVRWFWPGALGEDFISSDKISIPDFSFRYHPEIRDRSGILHLTRLVSNKGKDDEKDWAKWQRMQLSSLSIASNHGFSDWWDKFGKTNPEYFGLLFNGNRVPYNSAKNVKICQSNPAVWEQWLKEVDEKLRNNPNQTTFSAAANDGWGQGHCTCNNCKAWDRPPGPDGKPILSDRDVTFANKLATGLEKKFPGKGFQVVIMGYGYSRPAPQKAKPLSNVMIVNVSNFHMRDNGIEDERDLAMKQYADWGGLTKNLSWRPNLGNPAGLSVGMPDVYPRQAAIDFAWVAKYGCKGLYFDSFWNFWANQGIQYYVDAQLAWNPNLDIEKLLADYYRRAYGPAVVEMEKYWNLMTDTRNAMVRDIKNRDRFPKSPEYYTEKWFEKADGLLQQAKAKCKNADNKYAERIAFTEAGLLYARLVVDTKKNMLAWEKNPADQQAKTKVLENWKKANQYKSSFPIYAVNWGKAFSNPDGSNMRGLHPNNPSNKKKVKVNVNKTAVGFE